MTTEVSAMISRGRYAEVWQRFCGFLDLTVDEFMTIQERLLREQLQRVGRSPLGQALMGDQIPDSVEAFRRRVRLTSYADYASYFDERKEDVLAEKPAAWAHTSGRSGQFKWAPYTARAYKNVGEGMFSATILSNARARGEVRIRPGDAFVYNIPARPYMSGHAIRSLAELFDFNFVPSVEKTEELSFEERIAVSFKTALRTGIDTIGSISSVLVKVAEQFASGASGTKLSADVFHPTVLGRLVGGVLHSKLQGRSLLPRDLWRVKGILVGGTDTDIYRDRLQDYWGVTPHEQYACTEAPGLMATNAWTHRNLYFLPDTCFYEFIPEEEWAKARSNPQYLPSTVLLNDLKVGTRYEMVITNFFGGPFLRYRLYDLIRCVSLADEKAGIKLPAVMVEGRDSDLIDLAGFTGLIDETLMWRAIEDAGLSYEDWLVRKETLDRGDPGLHLYIELREAAADQQVIERVHQQLVRHNRFYGDLANMLGYVPLRVTQLAPRTFARYVQMQRAAGADLSHYKPRHMNASDAVRDVILTLGGS
jgi:hypothetical protein